MNRHRINHQSRNRGNTRRLTAFGGCTRADGDRVRCCGFFLVAFGWSRATYWSLTTDTLQVGVNTRSCASAGICARYADSMFYCVIFGTFECNICNISSVPDPNASLWAAAPLIILWSIREAAVEYKRARAVDLGWGMMDGWIPQVIWECCCCWNDQKRVRAKDGRARVSWAFDSFGWNSALKSKC